MMIDWNKYHQQFGARVGELMKISPDTVKGYQTLSAANSATTKLGEKTRQLISVAVAVTTKCDGCIVHHTEAALKAGASREEIAEALGVAVAMNAGAALVYSTRVSTRSKPSLPRRTASGERAAPNSNTWCVSSEGRLLTVRRNLSVPDTGLDGFRLPDVAAGLVRLVPAPK